MGIHERKMDIAFLLKGFVIGVSIAAPIGRQLACYAYVERWLKAGYSASFLAWEERPPMQCLGVLQDLA
jgi:hypothetical protein